MVIKTTLEERGSITPEEIEMLTRASSLPIVFDEDSPELTEADLTWSAHGLTASQANAINQEYLEEYPSATLIRSAAPQYNCHSYAWYSTSASNRYWINDPSNYVNAGDYSSTDTARVGYIILYGKINRQPEHSGLVTSVSGGIANRVESKWGCLGLFEHDYDDCPYSTGTIRYYR